MATNIFTYTKNVAKSVAYSAIDAAKPKVEATTSFVETNKEFLTDVYEVAKDYRRWGVRIKNYISKSKIYQAGEEGFKAISEDIRTGKFYNKDRIRKLEEKSMGSMMDFSEFDDMNFDFGSDSSSDFDFGSIDDADTDTDEIVTATHLASADNAAAISDTVVKVGKAQSEMDRANTMMLFNQQVKANSIMEKGFTSIFDRMGELSQASTLIATTQADNSKKFYETATTLMQDQTNLLKELVELQRSMVPAAKEEQSEKPRATYSDVINANGVVNIREYGKIIKKNFANALPAEVKMLLGDSIGGEGSNMLLNFVSSPLQFISDFAAKTLFPKMIGKAMNDFDKTLGASFGGIIAQLNNISRDDDQSIIAQKLGQIFGIRSRTTKGARTGEYERGVIQWNGIAQKSLTEVIPGYLARIEALISGEGARTFSYESGKWVDVRKIKESEDEVSKSAYKSAYSDVKGEMTELLRKSASFTTLGWERMENYMDKFLTAIVKNFNGNPRMGLKEMQDKRSEFGDLDSDTLKLLYTTLQATSKATRAQLAGKSLEAKDELAERLDKLYANSPEYLLNHNDSNLNKGFKFKDKKDGGGVEKAAGIISSNRLDKIIDQKGHNVFWYLERMYNELVAFRQHNYGGAGTGGYGAVGQNRSANADYINFINGREAPNAVPDDNKKKKEEAEKRNSKYSRDDYYTSKYLSEGNVVYNMFGASSDADERVLRYRVEELGRRLHGDGTYEGLKNSKDFERYMSEHGTALNEYMSSLKRKRSRRVSDISNEARIAYEAASDTDDETKKDRDNELSLWKKVKMAETVSDKLKLITESIDDAIEGPSRFLSKVIMKADERLYNLVFTDKTNQLGVDGKPIKGFLNAMVDNVKRTFNDLGDWIEEKVLDPIKEKLGVEDFGDLFQKIGEHFGIDFKKTGEDFKNWLFKDNGAVNQFKDSFKDTVKSAANAVGIDTSSPTIEGHELSRENLEPLSNKKLKRQERNRRIEQIAAQRKAYSENNYADVENTFRAGDLLSQLNKIENGKERISKLGFDSYEELERSDVEKIVKGLLNTDNLPKSLKELESVPGGIKFIKSFYASKGYDYTNLNVNAAMEKKLESECLSEYNRLSAELSEKYMEQKREQYKDNDDVLKLLEDIASGNNDLNILRMKKSVYGKNTSFARANLNYKNLNDILKLAEREEEFSSLVYKKDLADKIKSGDADTINDVINIIGKQDRDKILEVLNNGDVFGTANANGTIDPEQTRMLLNAVNEVKLNQYNTLMQKAKEAGSINESILNKYTADDIPKFINDISSVVNSMEHANGSRMVTRTGLTTIHRGEMVIPAEYNPFYNNQTSKKDQIINERRIRDRVLRNGGINSNAVGTEAAEISDKPVTPEAAAAAIANAADADNKNKKKSSFRKWPKWVRDALKNSDLDEDSVVGCSWEEKKIWYKDQTGVMTESKVNVPNPDKYEKDALKWEKDHNEAAANGTEQEDDGSLHLEKVPKAINEAWQRYADENGFGEENKKVTTAIAKYVPSSLGGAAAGGLFGIGASALTGLAGTPIIGAALGAASQIVKKSDTLSNALFGEKINEYYDDGTQKRAGGVFDREIQDATKKYLPSMAKWGGIGTLGGMLTHIGPLGGLLIGSAFGFMKKNEDFSGLLFGDEGLFSNETKEKLKKAVPAMGVGGVIGGLTLGPSMGLLGSAAIGAASGFITTTNTFKDLVLGKEVESKDENGNTVKKREGGLLGALKKITLDPVITGAKAITSDIKDFVKKDVLEPLKSAVKPVRNMFLNMFNGIKDGIVHHVNNWFEEKLGTPMHEWFEDKILHPVTKWVKRLLFLPVNLANGIISAPFKLIGGIGNNLRANQIKAGKDLDSTAEERLLFRDKHKFRTKKIFGLPGMLSGNTDGYREFDTNLANASDEEVAALLRSSIALKNYGHDKSRVIANKNEEIAQYVDKYFDDKNRKGFNILFSKNSNVRKQILTAIKENKPEEVRRIVSKLKSRTGKKLSDADLTEFMDGLKNPMDEIADIKATGVMTEKEKIEAERALSRYGFHKNAFGRYNFDQLNRLLEAEKKGREKNGTWSLTPDAEAQVDATTEGVNKIVSQLSDMTTVITNAIAMAAEGKSIIDQDWMKKDYNGKLDERQIKLRNSLLGEKDHNKTMRKSDMDILRNSLDNKKKNWSAELDKAEINSHKKHDRRVDKISNIADNNGNHFVRDIDFSEANLNDKQLLKKLKKLAKQKYITKEAFELIGNEASPAGLKRVLDVIEAGYLMNEGFAKWLIDDSHNHEYKNKVKPVIKALKELSGPMKQKFISGLNLAVEKTRKRFINNWKPMRGMNLKQSIANYIDGLKSGVGNDFFDLTDKTKSGNEFTINRVTKKVKRHAYNKKANDHSGEDAKTEKVDTAAYGMDNTYSNRDIKAVVSRGELIGTDYDFSTILDQNDIPMFARGHRFRRKFDFDKSFEASIYYEKYLEAIDGWRAAHPDKSYHEYVQKEKEFRKKFQDMYDKAAKLSKSKSFYDYDADDENEAGLAFYERKAKYNKDKNKVDKIDLYRYGEEKTIDNLFKGNEAFNGKKLSNKKYSMAIEKIRQYNQFGDILKDKNASKEEKENAKENQTSILKDIRTYISTNVTDDGETLKKLIDKNGKVYVDKHDHENKEALKEGEVNNKSLNVLDKIREGIGNIKGWMTDPVTADGESRLSIAGKYLKKIALAVVGGIAAVGGIAGITKLLSKNTYNSLKSWWSETAAPTLSNTWETSIKPFLTDTLPTKLGEVVTTVSDKASEVITNAASWINENISTIGTALGEGIVTTTQFIGKLLPYVASGAWNALKAATGTNDRSKTNLEGNIVKSSLKAMANGSSGDLLKKATVKLPTIAGKIISPAVNASTTVAGSIIGAGGKAVTSAQRAIASSTLEKGGAEVIKDGAPYIIKNTSTGVYKATNRAIKELGEDGAKDLAKTATRNGSVSVTKSMLEDAATGGTKLATNTIKKTVGKNAAKTAEKEGVEAVLKTVSKSTQKELVQNVVQKSSVNISEDAVAAATKKLSNGAIAGKIAAAVNVWAKKAEKWFAAKIGAKNTTKLLKQVTTTTLWEKVLKKAGETVSGLATKLSASIATGGTLQLVFSTYDLIYPWLSDANTQQILGISTTPTILQKAIASLINVIANAPFCAYGLIPAEAFSWVLFDVVLPALDIDLGGISSARTESNSIVSAFNESMGTNLTVDEYNYLVNGKTTTGIFDNIYRATQGGKEGILKKINESAGTNYTLEDFEDWKNGTAYTVNSDGTVTVNSSNTDDSTDGSYVTADGVEGVASLGILSSIDNTLKTIVAYFTGESSDLDPDDYETVGSTNSQFLQDMENTYGIEAKYLSSDGYYTTTGSGSGRYSQRDNSINMRYNKATDTIYQDIKSSGCGPIAATNLINRNIKYGTGMIDPQDAANYALNKGYKETNGGTDPKYFTDYFAKNGIESTITSDRGLMKKAIKNGQQVVLMGQDKKYGMGGGTTPYGPNPHYVVATGMKGSNVVVDNPEEFDEYNLYDANNTINKSTTAIITNSKYGMGTDLWEKLPDDYVDKSNSSTTKTSTSSLKSAEAMQAISAHDTDKGSTGITYHSKYIDNAKYKDNEALKTKIDSLGDVTYDDISNTNTGYSLSYGNSILLSDLKSSYYNKNKNMLNSIDNKPEFNNGMSEKDFITVIAEYFSGKNVNEIVDPSDDDSTTNKKWYESALNSDFLKNIDIPSLVNYINSDVRTVPNFYKNTDNGDDFNSVAHLPSTYTIEPIYSLPLIYPAFAKGIAHTGDLYKYTDYGSEIMFAALKQAYKNANNAIFNKIINLNEYKTDSDLYNEKIKNSMKGILKYLYNGGQGEYSSFLANYYNLKNDYNDELESKYIETSEFPYLLSELFSPSFMTLSRLGDANTSITNDNSTYNKARFDMATGSTYELGESKSGSLLKNLFGSDASSFPDVLTPKMFKEIMSNAILNKNSLTDEELLINKIRKELKSINIPFESDTYPTFADYTSSGNLNIARAYIKHLKGLDEYIKASPSLKSLGNYTETEDGNTIDFGLTKMLDYWKDDIANIEDFPDYYGIDETGIPRVTNKSEEQLASTYYAKLFKKDPDEILTSDIQSAAKYNMDNIYNNNLEVINHTTKTLFGDATYKRTWKSNKPVLSVVGHNFTPSDIDYLSSIKDIITGENIKYTIGQKTYDDFYSAISSNGASDKNSVMSPYYDFVVLATALENAKKSNDYTSFTNISTPATGFFTDTAFQNPVFPSIYGTGDNISDINGYNYKNEIYSKSGYYNDRSVEDIIETFHNELLNSNRIIDLSKVSLAAPLSSSGATGNGESGGTTGETSESKESKKDMNDNLTDYLGGSQVDSHGNYIQQSDKGVTEFENEAYRDLRSFTELSPSDINNRVDKYYKSNNTPDNYRILSNMGATIASLAKEYKVDPRFIMAVMQCEFSFGKTGSNHLPKYNYGSIMTAGQQGYSGMHNFNSNLYINGVPGGQYGHNRILSAVKGNDGDEYSETNVNCKYTINTTAVKGALRNLFKFIGEVWFEDRQQYTLFDMQYGTYSYSGGHVDWINTIIGFMNEFAANETKDIIYCPPDEETLREFKTINGSNIDVDTLPDEGSASESFFELVKNLAKSIIGEDTWNTVTSLLNGEAFTGETASTLSDGTKLSSYLRDSKFKSARGFFSNIWKPSGSEENGVTSEFGPRLLNIYGKTVESEHYGIDLASSESNPNVLSPVSGTVINQPSNDKENDENGSYGNYVLVQDDSDNPKIHLFGHLKKDSVKVNEGDTVRRGKTILGKMGNSGCSSGDHLHYGVSNAPAKSGLVWQAYHTSLKSMMEDKAKNLGFSSKPSFDSNGWLDPDTYIANYEDEMGIGDGIETTTTDEDGNTTTSISSTSNNNKLTTVQDYIDKYPDAKDSILATTGLSEEEAATKKISDYPTPMQSAFFSSSNMKAIEARVAKENASKSTSSGEGSGKYSSLSDKLITNSKNVGGSEEPLRFTTSERALSKKLIQEAKARKESIKHPSGHYGMGGGSSDDELIKLNKTQAEFLATMTDTLTSIEAETKQRNEMIYAMLEAVQKGELSTDSSLYNTMMKSLRNSASSSSSGSSSYTSLNGDSDQTLVNTMISMVRQ